MHSFLRWISLLMLAGCAMPGRFTGYAPTVVDPPELSPRRQSFYRTPDPNASRSPNQPTLPAQPVPQAEQPSGQAGPTDPSGPKIVPPNSGVELIVRAGKSTHIGGEVEFDLTVVNGSDDAIGDLSVEAAFDDGLEFPGRADQKSITRTLDDLPSGQRASFKLTLVARQQGKLCAVFNVVSGQRELAVREVCIDCSDRKLDVRLLGPPARTVGTRAEFTLRVTNTTPHPLAGVRAELRYDAALKLVGATEGATRVGDRLRWTLGEVPAAAGFVIQAEFECLAESERACVSAGVSGDGDATSEVEACVTISAAGALRIDVVDAVDPITVGRETELTIELHNRGEDPLRDIAVAALIPPTLRVLGTDAVIDGNATVLAATIKDNRVSFDSIDMLSRNRTAVLHVRLRGLAAGDEKIEVQARHAGSTSPQSVVEYTSVNR